MRRIVSKMRRIRSTLAGPKMKSVQEMSDARFLALFKVDELRPLLAKGDDRNALVKLLDHYRRRIGLDWLSPPRVITDLRVDTEGLTRQQLVERAESVLLFHLSPSGVKPRVIEGGRIDWNYNASGSREWLLMLNRHAWWPLLGLAYQQTKDERFAEAFVHQMEHWLDENPPPHQKDEASHSWRLMEVALRLRISWIPSFQFFYESPSFTTESKLKMIRSIYDHATFLYLFQTSRNHLLRESNGLAYVSVYFPEFRDAQKWLRAALDRISQELLEQVNQDGSHIEMSTGYQWLAVDEFEKTYDLLRNHHLSLPREDISSRLQSMYYLLAFVSRPDGSFPQINDGFILWDKERLTDVGRKLDREDLIYVGSGGANGTAPKETSSAFRDAGLFVMRSDWTKNARYLLFDAGPYGGPHGHEDKLSIEVCAYGKSFIVDPGSFTYEPNDPFRKYFVGSQGHNTVLVDGKSQVRRWQTENRRPRVANGNYATWVSMNEFDYVKSCYCDGYGDFSIVKPEAARIISDVSHTRRVLFVKPNYWVIVDDLDARDLHDYQILFHTLPEILVSHGVEGHIDFSYGLDGPSMRLVLADSEKTTSTMVKGSMEPIQGWYSPDHHKKKPATTVVLESKSRRSATFATLLHTHDKKFTNSTVNFCPLETEDPDSLAFLLSSENGSDHLLLSENSNLKQFGAYSSRAKIAIIRTSVEGNEVSRVEWSK